MGTEQRTRATLRPGRPGTKRLVRRYGDRLIAVRYRYDPIRRVRLKTVELIEEEVEWSPSPSGRESIQVEVRVGASERLLQRAIRSAGGTWQPERKTWRMSASAAASLGLLAAHRSPEASIHRQMTSMFLRRSRISPDGATSFHGWKDASKG
jgi:hypothetical protein